MTAKPWPYPRTKREIVQVVVVVLACLLVGGALGLLQLHHYTKKSLTIDDTARAQNSLAGFASEAHTLAIEASQRHTLATYQAHYFATLDDQTESIVDYLQSHRASGAIKTASHNLQHHANQLRHTLQQTKDEHDSGKLNQAAATFAKLQKTIEHTEAIQ